LVGAERGGDSLEEVIDDGDDVAVAAITVAELRVGVQLAKGRRREKRKRFVAAVLDAVSIEAYDLDVAEAHAALLAHVRRAGTPRGTHDPINCPRLWLARGPIASRWRRRRRGDWFRERPLRAPGTQSNRGVSVLTIVGILILIILILLAIYLFQRVRGGSSRGL
jgi:predicted nucleic acid-binding protein